VRSRQPSLRNAYRRASPKPRLSFEPRVFRFPKSLRGEVIPNAAHRFAFANLELSQQRDVRASLGLGTWFGFRNLRFDFELEAFTSRSHQLPRCVLPTTATHYLTNCTRARGFPVLLEKIFRFFPSQKDRCVSRRLRSLQRGNPFLHSRSIRSRSPMSLRLSCFRHPPLRLDSIFSNGYRSCLGFTPSALRTRLFRSRMFS